FTGQILNNLVYDNAGPGIQVHYAGAGGRVANNTVYQTGGDALKVDNNSVGLDVRNNILRALGGSTAAYDIEVTPDSEVGLTSDYNDLYYSGGGNLGLWEGHTFGGPT